MRTALLVALGIAVSGCAHPWGIFRAKREPPPPDSLYWTAVRDLDPGNPARSVDSAVVHLDSYLASAGRLTHVTEAVVLRNLARNAQRLALLEAALQQPRAVADVRRTDAPDQKRDDSGSLREIQRLKDELAKANAELERIKKRIAEPKP